MKIDFVVQELGMRFYICKKLNRKVNVTGPQATLQSSNTAEDNKPSSQRIWGEKKPAQYVYQELSLRTVLVQRSM